MPNLRNAEKANRQNKKRALRNLNANAEIHSLRVKARKLLDIKNLSEVEKLAQEISKKLDKAAQTKLLKKNTVARYKSRLMKKVNALKKV
jgi:small subunit ribosomal protein S20